MNIWKSIILFVFMSFGLLNFKAEARKPAVDPVMGLSIEEYNHGPPSESKGFNFDQQEKNPEAAPLSNENQQPKRALNSINSEPPAQQESPSSLFYILISLLPFVVWFGVMKNLEEVELTETEKTADMYDLEAERQKKKESDHNDYPKAS